MGHFGFWIGDFGFDFNPKSPIQNPHSPHPSACLIWSRSLAARS
jgi:hypothetical protein